MRKRVLIVQPIHESGIKLLKKEVEVVFASDSSVETVSREIKGIHGVIVRTTPFPRKIIELADNLKVISRHGVGVDNIDIEAAFEHKIFVVNTPDANMVSVAEHTISLILGLAKRVIIANKATREGNFAIRDEFTAIDLNGKTLGIVGIGRIGSTVAMKCQAAFNMKILAYDPYLSPEKAKEIGLSLC